MQGHGAPTAHWGRGDLQGQGVGETSQHSERGRDDADEDIEEPERHEDRQHHQLPQQVVCKRRHRSGGGQHYLMCHYVLSVW